MSEHEQRYVGDDEGAWQAGDASGARQAGDEAGARQAGDAPGAGVETGVSRAGDASGAQQTGDEVAARGSDNDARGQGTDPGAGMTPLLPEADLQAASQRWHEIQSGFVDDPRRAVADADALVGVLVQQITRLFDHERAQFEALWDRGDHVSTEELRVGLQRYRNFFERLLST